MSFADIMQWLGFVGTVVGYAIVFRCKAAGAFIGLLGVLALGLWAIIVQAWGVFCLEAAFVAINLQVLWGCWRDRGVA